MKTLILNGPPNSPPTCGTRLTIITVIANNANTQNMVTEKPKLPASTLNCVPLNQWYTAANVHAKPMPKKTFTAFEPVTLPTELSAYLSLIAATLLANVSIDKTNIKINVL